MATWKYKTPDGETGTVEGTSKAAASQALRKALGIKGKKRLPYGTKLKRTTDSEPRSVAPEKQEHPPAPLKGKTVDGTTADLPIKLTLSDIEAEQVLDMILDNSNLVRVTLQLVKELRRKTR